MPELNVSAYLVATIDTQTFEVVKMGIYSCPASSLAVHKPGQRYVDITHLHGTSYEDAENRLTTWARAAGLNIDN